MDPPRKRPALDRAHSCMGVSVEQEQRHRTRTDAQQEERPDSQSQLSTRRVLDDITLLLQSDSSSDGGGASPRQTRNLGIPIDENLLMPPSPLDATGTGHVPRPSARHPLLRSHSFTGPVRARDNATARRSRRPSPVLSGPAAMQPSRSREHAATQDPDDEEEELPATRQTRRRFPPPHR